MTRTRRKPTEAAKRRLVAACREAGLRILSARNYLRDDQGDRVIHVCASAPERPFEQVSISIRTAVTVTGDWTRMLDIRCAARVGRRGRPIIRERFRRRSRGQ